MSSTNKKIGVGIVGCGKIFKAHLRAIGENSNLFELRSVCDLDQQVLNTLELPANVSTFNNYRKMLSSMKGLIDLVVVATPNSLHQSQAIDALNSGYDVLIEKPVAFTKLDTKRIEKEAAINGRNAYGVLQVRYNRSVEFLRKIIDSDVLGKLRSASLVQRWQRPIEYFMDWRGNVNVGGRTLYEVGIHYLDIMRLILGNPSVFYTKTFHLKHKVTTIEDTIYSIMEFPNNVAGSVEISIAVEPRNLECSLNIIGENGVIKLGGKALNLVKSIETCEKTDQIRALQKEAVLINENTFNKYGSYQGSSSNHPELYKRLAMGKGIKLIDIAETILFIENIYNGEQK